MNHHSQLIIFIVILLFCKSIDATGKLSKMSWADVAETESPDGELDSLPTSNGHNSKTIPIKKSAWKPIPKKSTPMILRDMTLESPPVSPESSTISSPTSTGTQSPPHGIEDAWRNKTKIHDEHEAETNSMKKDYGFTFDLENGRSESSSWRSNKSSPEKELSTSKILIPFPIDSNYDSSVNNYDYEEELDDCTPAPIYLGPTQTDPWFQHYVQPTSFDGFTEINSLNNDLGHQSNEKIISEESQVPPDFPYAIPMGPRQKDSYLTTSEDKHLTGVMSARFLEGNYALKPYVGYITSASMHTLAFFHEDIVTIVETHPKVERAVIEIPSPVQLIAVTDTRLLVLTQDARVLLYDIETSRMLGKVKKLEISQDDVLDIHEMILHDNNFSFKMNDSLYVASLDNIKNLKKIADNVTILNGRSMFIAYSTIRGQDTEVEEGADKGCFERSIEVYEVAKGITKGVLLAAPDVHVSASQKYIYIIQNMHLEIYNMIDNMVFVSITISNLSNQDLVHYNAKNELWVLKQNKNLCRYSKETGALLHCYNLNIDDQAVYPNDDWTAFQIGEDLVTMRDFKVVRFGDYYDSEALATQIILPQRVCSTVWTKFNGEIALQRSLGKLRIVNTLDGTTTGLSTHTNNINYRLWPQGIYIKNYTYPDATYQFYIGDDTSTTPVYTIHDYDPQNDHKMYIKTIPAGGTLAFVTHKATDTSASYIKCYDMSRTGGQSPIWYSMNFKMLDILNSRYIWDNVDKTLVNAFTGHILLGTNVEIERSVCTLKNNMYALTTDQLLLHFTIPSSPNPQRVRLFPKMIPLKKNYSRRTITSAFQIRNGDQSPRRFLILFDRSTSNLEIMDLPSMASVKEINLRLPKAFTEKRSKAKFIWSIKKFGKRQLWLNIEDATGKALLYRVCTGYTRKYIE